MIVSIKNMNSAQHTRGEGSLKSGNYGVMQVANDFYFFSSSMVAMSNTEVWELVALVAWRLF